MEKRIFPLLQNFFRPEFLNRIDDTIIFQPITEEILEQIIAIHIDALIAMIQKEKSISVSIEKNVYTLLLREGLDPAFGARPLKRVIQRYIVDILAMHIIERKIASGDSITIDFIDEKIIIQKK